MRVLLDNECTAVAGGHESECVQTVTNVAIATGTVIGGVAGAAAGGVGAISWRGCGRGRWLTRSTGCGRALVQMGGRRPIGGRGGLCRT